MRLADVGGNKQVDAGSKIVAFLKEFVEENDDEDGDDELKRQAQALRSLIFPYKPVRT